MPYPYGIKARFFLQNLPNANFSNPNPPNHLMIVAGGVTQTLTLTDDPDLFALGEAGQGHGQWS
ncbi:MAG: hypothetical protein K6G25_12925 [Bacteroidales bacterium]|nr:hypothetical protein [Bacteroidales bacterium]